MVELLLKYYNGEDQGHEFVESLSATLKVLCRWRFCGKINPQSLLNFVIDQVLSILHEIKNKLIYKAVEKYELLNGAMRSDTDGAAAGPQGNDDQYVKAYPECPMAFDQMVISLTQYFDLVNLCSIKLEDLWLNLLDVLDMDRPNSYTVFKAVHH